MAGAPIVEIREPGRPPRRVVVDRAIEVGRECDGEVVSDEGVSRRHLRLVPSPVALSVVDLGSRNGTLLNGVPITGRAVLEPGATVRLGSTEIIMIGRSAPTDPGGQEVQDGPAPARRTLRAGQAAAPVIPPPPPPPAPPEAARAPSPASRFWAQVLGTGLSMLLLAAIIGAFTAGIMFKGKSGWCSSICPLLPLQRVYGQTPFVKVANSHCQPCVGCTKNCYDFRPSVAYQADLHEPDPAWTSPRKLFAAAPPGYVLGFFLLVDHPSLALPQVYLRLALYFLGSVGLFYAVQALLPG